MVLMNLLLNSSRDLDIEKRLMDMAGLGEEEEGGMYGESNMETYIIICLKKKILFTKQKQTHRYRQERGRNTF